MYTILPENIASRHTVIPIIRYGLYLNTIIVPIFCGNQCESSSCGAIDSKPKIKVVPINLFD